MDALDTFSKILDITQDIIELVKIFKDKDKWFERNSLFLQSLIETMTKYRDNRNPDNKMPIACGLLQNELNAYKEFLEKEQKRSNLGSFFRGLSMVKEAQDLQDDIDKQIHNFNLALNVDSQIETNKNFNRLITAKKGQDANNVAAGMWAKDFLQDEQVSWPAFSKAMKNFALNSERLELSDIELEVIVSKLDSNKDHLISFDEWNRFYEDIWLKKDEKLKFLRTKPVFEKKSPTEVPPICLKVTQINSEDPKHFRYPFGHKFYISEEKIVFQNYDDKEITLLKNWDIEAVIVGRNKPGIYQPDIYFHQRILSIKDKQFQIGLKKTLNIHGFFLKNLAGSNPTSLKIENIPYVLGSKMIFNLSETLIEIEKIEPEPLVENFEDDNPEYFYVNFSEKIDIFEDPSNAETRKHEQSPRKHKKKKVVLPSITLKIIQGTDEKKDAITITLNDFNEEKVIKIGSNDKNDVVVKDREDVQLMIKWDATLKAWLAFTEEKKNVCEGAYLYLIPSNEYIGAHLKQGKLSVKLRDKMKIAFGYNELEVITKK